ncbi:MAG: class I SAM-dependent methyltransferase [Rhizobiaceae bacterium]
MAHIFSKPAKRFRGYWEDRTDSLFSIDVDYAGKAILDIGCNMGVVAYEIAKRKPAFIHGIDPYGPHIFIARSIFDAVPVESKFERGKVGTRRFDRILRPRYDIVMMLAVYHYIERQLGPEKAHAAIAGIAARTDMFIVRDPGRTIDDLTRTLEGLGFNPVATAPRTERIGGLTVFQRN